MSEKTYKVTWTIFVKASSHKEAAFYAKEIQEDPLNSATMFEVSKTDSYVDLTFPQKVDTGLDMPATNVGN